MDANDRNLLRRYHEQGDRAAREQLIERYMSLVRSLARRYASRGEQLDDLIQIGAIGLIKAIDRFDIDRGVELTTYATPNIIGEIKRHFRDHGWAVRVPRGLQELSIQLMRVVEQLTGELSRSPTIAELAEATGASDPLESLGSDDHEYEVSEDRAVLEPGLRVLDDRERMILQLRFYEGLTQSQIAQRVGISQMHVSRLIRRALEKARNEIAPELDEVELKDSDE
jgi:RNA polymerase sigma-B factor